MSTLFSKNCAQKLNWCGRNRDPNSPQKFGLKAMRLTEVIMKVVRIRFPDASTHTIERSCMNWLRNSRDMLGGRKARRPSSSSDPKNDGHNSDGENSQNSQDSQEEKPL